MSGRYRGAIATHPDSPVVNSQPAGIGRLSVFPSPRAGGTDRLAINNLGRNLEFARLDGAALVPTGVFASTDFPNEDEPSQFDLDFHDVLLLEEAGLALALNHHGLLRAFPAAEAWGRAGAVVPSRSWRWAGDVVRSVAVGSCLVSTGSAGYAVEEPARPGIFVSAPLDRLREEGVLAAVPYLERWGAAGALAVDPRGRGLLVGFGSRVALASIERRASGEIRLGAILWERRVEFRVAWLAWDGDSGAAWAAGPEQPRRPAGEDPSAADGRTLDGGGAVCLEAGSGRALGKIRFSCRLAWGNGGVPLCVTPGGGGLLGMGADGALTAFTLRAGEESWKAAIGEPPLRPLGIAHMALAGRWVLCGFNRDGFRLHRYEWGDASG
jgi:hypothetical protein